MFYERKDPYKTVKELTYHIGNVGVELKESNQNRQDIDIAAFTYNDAKYIRKEIQINNEDQNTIKTKQKEQLKATECKQEGQILGKRNYFLQAYQ